LPAASAGGGSESTHHQPRARVPEAAPNGVTTSKSAGGKKMIARFRPDEIVFNTLDKLFDVAQEAARSSRTESTKDRAP
jgi:hypothetical protein